MKFIHWADSHIGVETIGKLDPETRINLRVMDFLDAMDAMIDFAEEEDVDVALFAGDAFHTNSPSQAYINEFAKRITRLRKQCPVVLLVGNHDMKRLELSALQIYDSLSLDNVIVGNSYKTHMVDTKSGKIQVTTFPYPTKQLLKEGEYLQDKCAEIIEVLASNIDDEYPSIFLGHFSVDTAVYGSERSLMIGADASVSISSLNDPAWDYVALGHIHMHQDLSVGTTKIIYPGSLERVNFSEEHEDKGFIFGELEVGKTVQCEFIQVDARPYKTIEIDIPEDSKNPTSRTISKINKFDIEGAVVRVLVNLPEIMDYSIIRVRELENVLEEAGVFHGSISVTKPHPNVYRAISKDFTVSSSPRQLLEMYLVDVLGKDADECKKLMSVAIDIMEVSDGTKGN